ncbi:MAG: hypothetical protein ACHQUC_07600 [Chlamydiales bacterium]
MSANHTLASTMSKFSYIFLSVIFLFSTSFAGQETDCLKKEGFVEGVTIDLREPLYSDGVLTTEQGGVITAPQLRVQALKIRQVRKIVDGVPILTIEAEDQLIIDFGEYTFVGTKLFYDLQKREGVIENGRTSSEPWYFGGEKIELRADGSYLIYHGYLTTSEKEQPDWGIYSDHLLIEEEQFLSARHIHLRLYDYNILWIPNLRMNLDTIFESPIRYRFKWGGRQGPRFGITYQVFSWERWKTFLRFDYRITRGPGGGVELYYLSEDHKTEFQSTNYVSRDSSLIHPNEKIRYRFEGSFHTSWNQDKTDLLLTYDKLSDIDLPQIYDDLDFSFETSKRTQLLIRHQEENWISNFYARVRVNSFQTVKQELPTFSTYFKPLEIARTGILFSNSASASYLDYKYSDNFIHTKDYSSTRFEYQPMLYRPFVLGPVTFTPEAGAVAIIYGNSPHEDAQWLTQGVVGCDLKTQLHRYYGSQKHVIEPYVNYRYYSSPTSSPHQHFIFDINDGWHRLNELTFGATNTLYRKEGEGCISRTFYSNLYAHTFFDVHTFRAAIPRLYTQFVFSAHPKIRHTINAAWDFEHNEIDHFNFRSEWTLNRDLAIAWEYRHRSAWSWRKVDPSNFFLEAFHDENRLRHSTVSDRRDTVLMHIFYRFQPNWACEIVSRQGWHRFHEPSYFEFEVNMFTTIQTAWNLQLSYQHQENEDRVAVYFNVGLKRPDLNSCENKICRFD